MGALPPAPRCPPASAVAAAKETDAEDGCGDRVAKDAEDDASDDCPVGAVDAEAPVTSCAGIA